MPAESVRASTFRHFAFKKLRLFHLDVILDTVAIAASTSVGVMLNIRPALEDL